MNQSTSSPHSSPHLSAPPSISVRGLAKTWPPRPGAASVTAVDGIDFDVAAGEVFGLLGPNGAGKSTTIGMLTTTVVPTAGHASLHGFDVASEPRSARAVSAVVFQDSVVDRALSGRRNLEIHARLWGVRADLVPARIAEQIEHFALGEIIDRPVGTYSGGQSRRMEIARALLSEPQVLFLDEPTVGLDPRIRHELLDHIAALRARSGMTVLLTTHYLDEAERLCDRIGVMHSGRIVALDSPANLLAAFGDEVLELRVLGDAAPALALLRTSGIAGADAFAVGNTITVPVRGRVAGDLAAAVARLELTTVAMSTRPPSLDDVYLHLTGDRIVA